MNVKDLVGDGWDEKAVQDKLLEDREVVGFEIGEGDAGVGEISQKDVSLPDSASGLVGQERPDDEVLDNEDLQWLHIMAMSLDQAMEDVAS